MPRSLRSEGESAARWMGSPGGGQGAEAGARCHWAVIDDSPTAGEEPPGLRRRRRGGEAMNISERQRGWREESRPVFRWSAERGAVFAVRAQRECVREWTPDLVCVRWHQRTSR